MNRHQWLVGLGQAYRMTGDESYSGAFVRYVGEWIEANPKGRGINWASSLEVALRLISWCWALFLFKGSPRLAVPVVAQMVEGIGAHAARIERYLSRYFAPNTHLTGEALGLVYAGVVFPEFPRAEEWRRQGMRILTEQSDRQISDDRVYFEQSTCYQRYTAEIYLHAMILAARNGLFFPPAVMRRIQSLLDFLLWVRNPDGSMPMIGDADGGWLLPLTSRAPDDLRGVFSTAAAWFGRSDYAWAAGGNPAPETLWLLGRPGLEAFEALEASPPARNPSRAFVKGGHAVMRTGWASDAHRRLRARARRSSERPVRRLRHPLSRGRRNLLLHTGPELARLFPQYRGPQHRDRRRSGPGRPRRALRLGGAATSTSAAVAVERAIRLR